MHWIFLPQMVLFLLVSLLSWRRAQRLEVGEAHAQQFGAATFLLAALISLIAFIIDA